MVRIFGTTLGNTQFKQMTVIVGLSLIGTVLITSYAVQEIILVRYLSEPIEALGYFSFILRFLFTNPIWCTIYHDVMGGPFFRGLCRHEAPGESW